MTSKVVYEGKLRTRMTHLESGAEVLTDAPKDNHGNGAAFSPTDLMATALGACMLSIMGIYARQNDIDIEGATVSIQKNMESNPRRVGSIDVHIKMPKNNYSQKEKKALENAAHTCPVAKSLHPDLRQNISFEW